MRHCFSTFSTFVYLIAAVACSSPAPVTRPNGAGSGAGGSSTGGSAGTGGSSGGSGGSALASGSGGMAGGESTGSGGTSGSGGTTGGSGGAGGASGGTGGASGPGPCPTDAIFCTGFEDAGIPEGMLYQPQYKAAEWATHMAFQTAVVNSGSQALEVKNTSEYWAMLSLAVPVQTFWVRVYMRSTEDWGQTDHNSFLMAMTGDGDQNGGDNMEVSEQYCQPVLNIHDAVTTTIGGSEACGTGSGPLAKDTWRCVEVYYDGAGGNYQVFADNTQLIELTGEPAHAFATFALGYVNFHGPQRAMFYDDLVVAPTRVGCP